MLYLAINLVRTIRTWIARERLTAELSRLSDRQLADVGLRRGDIWRITHTA